MRAIFGALTGRDLAQYITDHSSDNCVGDRVRVDVTQGKCPRGNLRTTRHLSRMGVSDSDHRNGVTGDEVQ